MQSYKNFFIYARKIVIYNDSKLEKFNTFFWSGRIFFVWGNFNTFFLVESDFFRMGKNLTLFFWSVIIFFV